ncbi:Serpentine Receptor, class T [Aphelenchoides fujianensis]|nr:Serpentine Receptor, class T [Aphelenchoides fujianensis]
MELLLFDRPKFDRLYNCSGYDVDQIPLEVRRNRIVGVVYVGGWAIFTPLYMLCLWAMWSQLKQKQATAYCIMFTLGCIHLMGQQMSGLVAGLFAFNGVVFCSCPILNYVTSSFALGSWVTSTLLSLILGFNRCLVLYDRSLNDRVFGGFRLVFWLAVPLVYGAYVMVFTPAIVYNSIIMAYVFNPHLGYRDDPTGVYHSTPNRIHNSVIFCTEIILYVNLIRSYNKMASTSESKTKLKYERQVYIPVLLIGAMHFMCGFVYFLLDTISVPPIVGLIGTTAYWLSQGLPAVVYLIFNQTIRATAMRRLRLKSGTVSSTAYTVQASNSTAPPTHN